MLRIEREFRLMSNLQQRHSVKSDQKSGGGFIINSGGTSQMCHKEGHLATES